MKEKIILVGGGGHCKSCIDVIEAEGRFEIIGIVDSNLEKGSNVLGYVVLGDDDDLPKLLNITKNVLITIGQIKSSETRRKIALMLEKLDAVFPSIFSPKAHISSHSSIAGGTIVMHGAIVNSDTHLGRHCIINSQSLLEHEVKIGDFCHISTGVKLNGNVIVGNDCFIGSSATVYNGKEICDEVIVPAGSIIRKNIEKSGVYRTGWNK